MDDHSPVAGSEAPGERLSVFDWVLILYAAAFAALHALEAFDANPMWIEAGGWAALAVLARPDTNRGRAALIHVAVLAVIAVPELVWATWTGDWVLAAVDVAYLALAWALRSDLTEAARPAVAAITGRRPADQTDPAPRPDRADP